MGTPPLIPPSPNKAASRPCCAFSYCCPLLGTEDRMGEILIRRVLGWREWGQPPGLGTTSSPGASSWHRPRAGTRVPRTGSPAAPPAAPRDTLGTTGSARSLCQPWGACGAQAPRDHWPIAAWRGQEGTSPGSHGATRAGAAATTRGVAAFGVRGSLCTLCPSTPRPKPPLGWVLIHWHSLGTPPA